LPWPVGTCGGMSDSPPSATTHSHDQADRGLPTDLITHALGEATPVAQVIVLPNGNTVTIGRKYELQVPTLLHKRMQDQAMRQTLTPAGAVSVLPARPQ
jgi:hypothetical protein